MVGTHTYDAALNTITSIGGTPEAPIGLVDLWSADKAGSLELMPPSAAALGMSLTRQVRPADKAALKLNVVVTNLTAAGTCVLNGEDLYGLAQSETLNINGNGIFVTVNYFSSIDPAGVDCTGTFTLQVTQSQWGVVWKQGSAQFAFDCKIAVGNGSTQTYFAEKNQQITMNSGVITATADKFIKVNAKATFTLGVVVNEALKITSGGCSLLCLDPLEYYYPIWANAQTTYVFLYGCSFNGANLAGDQLICLLNMGGFRVWNCQFNGRTHLSALENGDVFNITSLAASTAIRRATNTNVDKIVALGCWYSAWFQSQTSQTIKNVYSRGATQRGIRVETIGSYDQFLVNPDFDNYTLLFVGEGMTGKVYRQYEFDLTITDKANNPLQGAVVTLKDNASSAVFVAATDENGAIPTQTVSRGYFQQATQNTLQDLGPHTLIVTKPRYQTYTKTFVLNEKTNWSIKLAKTPLLLMDFSVPLLNLKPTDPENAFVLHL